MYTIYQYIDTETGKPFYTGLTNGTIKKRLSQRKYDVNNRPGNTRVNQYIIAIGWDNFHAVEVGQRSSLRGARMLEALCIDTETHTSIGGTNTQRTKVY